MTVAESMIKETHKRFNDDQYRIISDYILPLWGLLGESEQQTKIKGWLNPRSATPFTRLKLVEVHASILGLQEILRNQSEEDFWNGIPYADGLATIRKNEFRKVFEFNCNLLNEILRWEIK